MTHAAPPGDSRASRAEPSVLAALSLLVSAGYVAAEVYFLDGGMGYPLDDSWIHLAFGRSLAAGEGLSIDPGRPVAGSTAPLWTALFGLWAWLPGSAIAWSKLAGALLQAAVVVQSWSLARDLLAPSAPRFARSLALLAGLLTALTSWLAWASVSGMEIPLFTLLTLVGMRLHLHERGRERAGAPRPPLSLAVFGVAVLARPEGLLLLALAVGDRLLVRGALRDPAARARLAAGVGLALLAIVPVALYQWAIGGSPLPTTLAVKTGHAGGLGWPSLRTLAAAFQVLIGPQPWALLLAPAGAFVLARRLGGPEDRGLLPALWLAGLPLAYACLGTGGGGPLVGNFGRYLFPLFPLVAVLGVVGLAPVAAAVAGAIETRPARHRLLAALVLAALLAPTAVDALRGAGRYVRNVANVEDGDVAMARWLAPRLPPEATLAVVDLGAAAAILPNPIVDLAGIASPDLSAFVRRARAEGRSWQYGVFAFLARERPDYVLVFPGWLTRIESPGSPYRRVHSIRVPGNVTLGGDEIVLYATPWTRTRYSLRAPTGDVTGER